MFGLVPVVLDIVEPDDTIVDVVGDAPYLLSIVIPVVVVAVVVIVAALLIRRAVRKRKQ